MRVYNSHYCKGIVMNNKNAGAHVANSKRTPEERKALAKKMVESKKRLASLSKAAYKGCLHIADIDLNCCVLDNGQRLVSEIDIQEKFGGTGGKSLRLRQELQEFHGGPIPLFLASKPLLPLISKNFNETDLVPVEYNDGGKVARGYPADIIPKVCETWLEAREQNLLQPQQLPKAKKAEILIRGFARVGIVALIDEATGYERDRERNALAKILEAYVAKEIQPYMKTFDASFYEEMFRLRGLPYPPEKANFRPQYFGTLTNNIVYDRLAPGVKDALKKEAKKVEKSTKLFQHLTADYGRQELIKHLGFVEAIMKISTNWDDFIIQLDKVKPRFNTTKLLL